MEPPVEGGAAVRGRTETGTGAATVEGGAETAGEWGRGVRLGTEWGWGDGRKEVGQEQDGKRHGEAGRGRRDQDEWE